MAAAALRQCTAARTTQNQAYCSSDSRLFDAGRERTFPSKNESVLRKRQLGSNSSSGSVDSPACSNNACGELSSNSSRTSSSRHSQVHSSSSSGSGASRGNSSSKYWTTSSAYTGRCGTTSGGDSRSSNSGGSRRCTGCASRLRRCQKESSSAPRSGFWGAGRDKGEGRAARVRIFAYHPSCVGRSESTPGLLLPTIQQRLLSPAASVHVFALPRLAPSSSASSYSVSFFPTCFSPAYLTSRYLLGNCSPKCAGGALFALHPSNFQVSSRASLRCSPHADVSFTASCAFVGSLQMVCVHLRPLTLASHSRWAAASCIAHALSLAQRGQQQQQYGQPQDQQPKVQQLQPQRDHQQRSQQRQRTHQQQNWQQHDGKGQPRSRVQQEQRPLHWPRHNQLQRPRQQQWWQNPQKQQCAHHGQHRLDCGCELLTAPWYALRKETLRMLRAFADSRSLSSSTDATAAAQGAAAAEHAASASTAATASAAGAAEDAQLTAPEGDGGCQMDEVNASTYVSIFERIYALQRESAQKKPFSVLSSISPSPSSAFPAESPCFSSQQLNPSPATASTCAARVAQTQQVSSAGTQHQLQPAAAVPPDAAAGSAATAGADSAASPAAGYRATGNDASADSEPAEGGGATATALDVPKEATGSISVAQGDRSQQQQLSDTQQQGLAKQRQPTEENSSRERQPRDEILPQRSRSCTAQQPYISKHVLVCALADLARAGVRTPQAWQSVLLLVLLELPRFSARQLQQIAAALQRGNCCCPLVLQGITEAFYWRCEEKKGDVEDCVLLLDALRRLRYRPSLRHVNKVVDRIREGRRKLTVSLCLKLLRFFVETRIAPVELKHPSFYWGVLTIVQRSVASLHPAEIVAFARLLTRLNLRDEAVYERLCMHLYNRSRDLINSNVRTASCMQDAILSPGASALAAVATAGGQQRSTAYALEEGVGRDLSALPAGTRQRRNSSLQQQHLLQHSEQRYPQQTASRHDPVEPIPEDAAFLPALLHLGRAFVQAKLLTMPSYFWLALKQHTEQHFEVMTPAQTTFLLNLLSRYHYRDTSLLNKLGYVIEKHVKNYPAELLVSALNSLASLSYRHRTLHACLSRHLLRSVLPPDLPRLETLVRRCALTLRRASAVARQSSDEVGDKRKDSSSTCSGAGSTHFADSTKIFYSAGQTAADSDGSIEGRAKPLPRDVHLPLPMFDESTSEQNRRAPRGMTLPVGGRQQREVVPAQQPQQEQPRALQGTLPEAQSLGETGRALLPRPSKIQRVDVHIGTATETVSPMTATHTRELQVKRIILARTCASPVVHAPRSDNQHAPHPSAASSALPQEPANAVRRTVISRTGISHSTRHSCSRDGSVMSYRFDCSRSSTAHEAGVVRSGSDSAVCAYRLPHRGELALIGELQEGNESVILPSSTSQQQERPALGETRNMSPQHREEMAYGSSSGGNIAQLCSRTEARVLQVAARFIPGRIDASVATALLQACAATGHRNVILLSCLIASLRDAISHVQAAPSRPRVYSVGTAASSARSNETAVGALHPCSPTAPLVAGVSRDQKADSLEIKNESCNSVHRDQGGAASSRLFACASDEANPTQACGSSMTANVAKLPKQAVEPVYSNTREESGYLSPHTLECLLHETTAAADAGTEVLKRRVFVGLHELRGLVFRPQRARKLPTEDDSTREVRHSGSTISQEEVVKGPHSTPNAADVQGDPALPVEAHPSTSALLNQQDDVGPHPSTTEEATHPGDPVDESAGAESISFPNTERVQGRTISSEAVTSSSVSATVGTAERCRALEIDERQRHDLQLLAGERRRTERIPVSRSSLKPPLRTSRLSLRPPVASPCLKWCAAGSSCSVLVETARAGKNYTSTRQDSQSNATECHGLGRGCPSSDCLIRDNRSNTTIVAPPSRGGEGRLFFADASFGVHKTSKDGVRERVEGHLNDAALTEKNRRSSGMMRFKYNKSFFQKLRQAAMHLQGSDSEVEELNRTEYLWESACNSQQQSCRRTERKLKMSRGRRIARVASLALPGSHIERRVSAAQLQQAFWGRLFQGKRHPKARRLLHRRYFRMACRLRMLNHLQNYYFVQTFQESNAANSTDNSSSSTTLEEDQFRQPSDETAGRNTQRCFVGRRLAVNCYRPAQVTQYAMKRWSALRRCLLMPYQEHARLIHQEMRHVQQTSSQGLTIFDTTFGSHQLWGGDTRAASALSTSSYLYMYFMSASPTLAASPEPAHLPFLVDTQLLLPPEIPAQRGHWLAQSRLRCLYRRILRDNKRSQRFVKEQDASGAWTSEPWERAASSFLQQYPLKPTSVKHCDERLLSRGVSNSVTRTATAECVVSHFMNNSGANCSPGLPMHSADNLASRVHSPLSGADSTPLVSRTHALPPGEIPHKDLCYNESPNKCDGGFDSEVTRQHGPTDVAPRTYANAVELLTAPAHIQKDGLTTATDVCGMEKRKIALAAMVANHGPRGKLLNRCPLLIEEQAAAKRNLMKSVPLLREACDALRALVELQFCPPGVLQFLVEHIYWAVRLLAEDVVEAALRVDCATAAVETLPCTSKAEDAAVSGRLSDTQCHSRIFGQRERRDLQSAAQESLQAEFNVTDAGLRHKRALERSSVASQLLPHAMTIHLISVLRSVNTAAAAATAALAAVAEKPAKAAHCTMAPTPASFAREMGGSAVPNADVWQTKAASLAGTLSPTRTPQSPQPPRPVPLDHINNTGSCGQDRRVAKQQRSGGPPGITLSQDEAGAVCTVLEKCYRSNAFIPLLTTRHRRMSGDDSHMTVILDAARLYAALLRRRDRGGRNDVLLSTKSVRHNPGMHVPSKCPLHTARKGLLTEKETAQTRAIPVAKTGDAEDTRTRVFTPCHACGGGTCLEIHPAVDDFTQTKRSFFAILVKYMAGIVGISPPSSHTCLVMLQKKSSSHGCLGAAEQHHLEKRSHQIADNHCHRLAHMLFQRRSPAAPACSSEGGGGTKTSQQTRNHVLDCVTKRSAETDVYLPVKDRAGCLDGAAESHFVRQASVPEEYAAAEQRFLPREGETTVQEIRARGSAAKDGTDLFTMAYTRPSYSASIIRGHSWHDMVHNYAHRPIGGDSPLRLSTEQMSTLLRTLQTLDELSDEDDPETMLLLETLRKVLNGKLKRIICCEGHRGTRGTPTFRLSSPEADGNCGDASAAAGKMDLPTRATGKGEFRRAFLTALVTLTLDEISRDRGISKQKMGTRREDKVLVNRESLRRSTETLCPQRAVRECHSSRSANAEETLEVTLSAARRQKACSLHSPVAKLSSAAGVPRVLLQKLVERELARHGEQLEGSTNR